jgi:[DsrC]-trisulfide reductase subunit J
MYDTSKVVPALILFAAVVTFPFWYRAAAGASTPPKRAGATASNGACVAPLDFMGTSHMVLLDDWRREVVRGNGHTLKDPGGHTMSLTAGCLKCHHDRAQFCDHCHDYVAVQPDCWSCHVTRPGSQTTKPALGSL